MTAKKGTNKKISIYDDIEKVDNQEIKESLAYNSTNKIKKEKIYLSKDLFENNGIILTEKQNEVHKLIRNNIITVIQGPAGTAKTLVSCYTALTLLIDKKIDRIIITKPIQEAGENLGFLPGALEDKVGPYMKSYDSTFIKLIGKQAYEFLRSEGIITTEVLAYMRGETYDNCVMLLDEAQNLTIKQLMLWVTRIGKNSKAVLNGDVSQYDINKNDVKLQLFIDKILCGVDEVAKFSFKKEDVMRSKVLINIVDNYEKYLSEVDNTTKTTKKQLNG